MCRVKLLVLCILLLNAILGAHTKRERASCSKRKPPKNKTPTDFKVYKKTYTVVADGFLASRAEPWPKTWQNFWDDFESSAVTYGREVISWLNERYGIDASALTDKQLGNGEEVKVGLGSFTFRPMIFDKNVLNYRLLAETTGNTARLFRNTSIEMASYMFQAKETYTSTGSENVTIPKGAFVFKGGYIFYPDAECGSNDTPELITFVSKMYYLIDNNGFGQMDCDLFSEKYGAGNQIGMDVFSSFLTPPVTYRHSSVIFFPSNKGGQ
ncbi:unnamed protein product [Owenia fusiformis]|uniref:Uncharacterized protein n=1 Tax=Owenia fusiformis TaxID=6347 RepID=A0A8J1XMB5_OWEFU|nr:unnamed protein product [Owenia fusiformis]